MRTQSVTEGGQAVPVSATQGRRSVRVAALSVVAGLAVVTLSGCSMAWASMAELPGASARTASPVSAPAPSSATAQEVLRPAATPAATATAVPVAPSGDLATGSATHVLPAGAAQLAVDYWTSDAPAQLGAAAASTVQLSAHLEGAGASAETRVSRFRATAPEADGSTAVLVDDAGSFSITAPYSYSTVVEVPTRGVGSTTTVRLQWDLLVETAPGSGAWFRQTVLDQLVIGLPASHEAVTAAAASAASASSTSSSSSSSTAQASPAGSATTTGEPQ